jgi:hypothetical protein
MDTQPTLLESPALTSDNNIYWDGATAPVLQWNGANYSLAGFQAASGQDLHSKIANPLFKNVPTSAFDYTQAQSTGC